MPAHKELSQQRGAAMLLSRVLTSLPPSPPPCLLPARLTPLRLYNPPRAARPDTHTAITTEITWRASLSSPDFTPSVSNNVPIATTLAQSTHSHSVLAFQSNPSNGLIFFWIQKWGLYKLNHVLGTQHPNLNPKGKRSVPSMNKRVPLVM